MHQSTTISLHSLSLSSLLLSLPFSVYMHFLQLPAAVAHLPFQVHLLYVNAREKTRRAALLSVISQFCQCFAGDLQVARCALHVVVCALVAMAGAPVRQLPVGRTLPFVSPPATCHTTAHPRCTNRTLRNRLPKLNRTKPAGSSCRLRLRSPSLGPVA